MTGQNAFIGPVSANSQRFIDVSNVYSLPLRRAAYKAAVSYSLDQSTYQEGVVTQVSGPMYESPAEARCLRQMGANVVCMGHLDETVAARNMNMEVLMLTIVADRVSSDPPASGMNAAAIGVSLLSPCLKLVIDMEQSGGKQIVSSAISHREISAVCKDKAPVVTKIIVAVIDAL